MIVTSGFRRGHGRSQHYKGQAADLQFTTKTNKDYYGIAEWIKNNLPHDQLLLEYKSYSTKKAWIHVSYNKSTNRNTQLTIYKPSVSSDKTYVGLINMAGTNGIPV
jgi:hypothetical protein